MGIDRHVVMYLHEVQRNVDFMYFEAARPDTMPDSERPDGYYFPKRDWVEMDMPETITVSVKTGMVEKDPVFVDDQLPLEGQAL